MMKHLKISFLNLPLVGILFLTIMVITGCNDQQKQVNAEEPWDELVNAEFVENYPTTESADRLYDEVLFQRACQVVIWSLPATALWAMKKGSEAEFGEGSNVFPIWKDRLSAETIVSTPNSDVIYGMGYLDLGKDGPTVIEVPPKLQGILDDFWHRPLTDVGFVGPDKGEGGKYLILPPDFKGESPEGYFTFKSSTYNVFVFWRAFRDEDGGTKEGVALMERTKIYPLSKKDNPPEMVFPTAQLGDGHLAAHAFHYDADLLFRRKLAPRSPLRLADQLPGGLARTRSPTSLGFGRLVCHSRPLPLPRSLSRNGASPRLKL